jgi:hypothetical protein
LEEGLAELSALREAMAQEKVPLAAGSASWKTNCWRFAASISRQRDCSTAGHST